MKASRKIIPALAMLIVSAVVMTSASYAWFTMSKEVTANDMKVTVTAPNNLLIAGADETYTNFTAAGHDSTIADRKVYPASTVDGLKFFSIKDNSAINVTNGALFADKTELKEDTTGATATAEGAYADFKYVLKTDGDKDVEVQVSKAAITATKGGVKATLTAKDTIAYEPEAAAEGRTATAKNDNPFIAEYKADGDTDIVEVDFSYLKAVRFAVLTGETTGVAAYDAGGKCVYDAWGDNFEKETTANKAVATIAGDTNFVATKTATKAAVIGTQAAGTKVFKVTQGAGNTTTITVRVWLEGEDQNCVVGKAAGMAFGLDLTLRDAAYEG